MSDAKETKRMMRLFKEVANKYEMLEKSPAGKKVIDASKMLGKTNPYIRGASVARNTMQVATPALRKAYQKIVEKRLKEEGGKAGLVGLGLGTAIEKFKNRKKKK